jgi:polyribonucleotide nucleotidyltransferase
VTTLGTGQDEQIIDALEGNYRENFMLHYNFPPYSVGEVAAWARPAAAKSATASWPGARSTRAAGAGPTSPTRSASCRDHRVERLVLDGDGLRRLAGADGCGRAAEARPVAGIAMGLIKEGDGYRRPVRHPG